MQLIVAQGSRRRLGSVVLLLLLSQVLPGQPTLPRLPGPGPGFTTVNDKPAALKSAEDKPGESQPEPRESLPEPRTEPPKIEATHTALLAHYRRVALQNQPALAAYRASLCAAQTKVESIHKIGGIASLIRKDLDVRKEQVQYGVLAAQAQLSVAAWETLYAVTRNYWSCVYAQEMLDLADESLDPKNPTGIFWLRDLIRETVEGVGGRRDLTAWHLTSLDLILETLKAKKIEAESGLQRAQAALREAMGVPCDYPIRLPQRAQIPWVDVTVKREKVIEETLKRRGEITQVMVFREVSCLEVDAQAKSPSFSLKGQTFASGSDIHVQSAPGQVANGEYRPGVVGPEMPGMLAGKREDRVQQAEHYAGRADAVVAKTKQLLTLQAEDAYWKYDRATREAEAYRKVVQMSVQLRSTIAGEFGQALGEKVAQKRPRPNIDDVLVSILKGSQLQLSLNQARYERILALTLLERVSAGGVNPGFDEPLPLRQPYSSETTQPRPENSTPETVPAPQESPTSFSPSRRY